MPRLAKKFTVIAVDSRGVGGSSATPDGYDVVNLAEDVHQLVQQLKLDRVYVAGFRGRNRMDPLPSKNGPHL